MRGGSTSEGFWPRTELCCFCCRASHWYHSNTLTLQGHRSAKATHQLLVAAHIVCSKVTRIVKAYCRSRVHVHRCWFSLPAYTWVSNFLLHFGRRNGGRLIRGMAYTRVYMVAPLWSICNNFCLWSFMSVVDFVLRWKIIMDVVSSNALCPGLDFLAVLAEFGTRHWLTCIVNSRQSDTHLTDRISLI